MDICKFCKNWNCKEHGGFGKFKPKIEETNRYFDGKTFKIIYCCDGFTNISDK